MPLRARSSRIAAVLAAAAVALLALAPGARAAGDLVLRRGQQRSQRDSIQFFLRGALPGEQVFYSLSDAATDEASLRGLNPQRYVIADATGSAFIPIRDERVAGAEGPFFVRAWVIRPDRRGERLVGSNFVLLRDVPELYLVVGGPEAAGRVVHFDPLHRRLDEALALDVDESASIALAGATAVVERPGGLLPLDGSPAAELARGEETLDLAATPDRSGLIALTRERLPGGRALLRLRLLDAGDLLQELGRIDVLRGGSLVAARLVTADDAHRVLLVAERDSVIREVTLGVEPGRGLTFLPLAPDGSEELVDVRVLDDLLVAVTRSAAGRPSRAPASRVILLDLRTRAEPVEWPLPARARAFELASSQGRPALFASADDGRILVLPIDDPAAGTASIELGGAGLLARSPVPSRLYVVASEPASGRSAVFLLDCDALTAAPLPLPELTDQVWHIGVLGRSGRQWLYLIERLVEDRLWCAGLDPQSGLTADEPTSHPLPGRVRPRGIAGR